MKLTLIQVPYHYGFSQARVGAGCGPRRYLEAGAEAALRQLGYEVSVELVERGPEAKETPLAVLEGNTVLAARVAASVDSGGFPVVLSGGCNACLGVLAGLGARLGIIWFDAHGDFNTPETTPSGFFDGMPLAVATGLCYRELWGGLSSAPPVPPAHALLVAVRDLDPGERDTIAQHGVLAVPAADIKALGAAAALGPKLAALRKRVEQIYLHFDIDALDPALAPGVDYRAPGGLSLEEAEEAIRLIAAQFWVRAATLAAYNPDHEEDDRTLAAGLRLLSLLAAAGVKVA